MRAQAKILLLSAVAVSCLSGIAVGQAPPAAAAPGDALGLNDPQLAKLRKLDWKSADFNALDAKHKCAALEALNHGLSAMGGKLDARAELMIDYIDQNQLSGAYAAAESKIADPPNVTFENLERLATAYIASPDGAAAFAAGFDDVPTAMLARYQSLYENSARREFADAMEGRWHVHSMGAFLQEQGKADGFRTWAAAEQKRRQAEFEQKQAQAQAKAAAQSAKQEQAKQAAAQQMALVMADMSNAPKPYDAPPGDSGAGAQPPPPQSNFPYASPAVYSDSDGWWPQSDYAVTGYYNNSAYRAAMNDKAGDAYQRWGHAGAGVGAPGVGAPGVGAGPRR
jgi:hypothetical protein